jgi:SH3-like domain-containing protein
MRRNYLGRNLILPLCFLVASGCAATQTTSKPAAPGPAISTPKPALLYVTADQVNLRACPSVKCQVAAVLKLGDEVIKLGQEQEWINVRVPATRREGWVASHLLGKTPREKSPIKVKEKPSPRVKDRPASPALELEEEFAP